MAAVFVNGRLGRQGGLQRRSTEPQGLYRLLLKRGSGPNGTNCPWLPEASPRSITVVKEMDYSRWSAWVHAHP